GAVGMRLVNLGHTSLASWDEVFHAVVARHMAQHPLEPSLYELAALRPLGIDDWQTFTHIWLHLPPLGMWAGALSMRLLGFTPFALRLPSVLYVAVGMVATFLLGRRLFGATTTGAVAGLAGAAFVGFAPYAMLLGQGYVFGDITDTPLLALTPLALLT